MKPSDNRKLTQLAVHCSWSLASPASHTQEAFACGGEQSKVKDAPRLDPLDPFPTKQLKHILVGVGDPIKY